MTLRGLALPCSACHRDLPPGQQTYTLRVDLYASAEQPEVREADLARDTRAELLRLADRLAEMDPDEAREETDRIFERRTYTLCAVCRAEIHDLLKGIRLPDWAH